MSPNPHQAPKILVLDNYDSFVYNLVQYLGELGCEVDVFRNDQITVDEAASYDGILVSPGPGTPEEAGISIELVKWAAKHSKPLLGVCLGHQAIGVAFGGIVSRAPELLHGKVSQFTHNSSTLFSNLNSPFTVTRYHSLAIEKDSCPTDLEISGVSESGVIMSVQHKTLPIFGVQFHPESMMTENGHMMLANWLTTMGDSDAPNRAMKLSVINKN
jgi:para-aminobenzoate synthetase component 2